MYLMQTGTQASDTWRDLANLGYSQSLELLGTPPVKAKPEDTAVQMNELRTALAELKSHPESAAVHRRVGNALKAIGRDEAAARSMQQAEALEAKEVAVPAVAPVSIVDDQD